MMHRIVLSGCDDTTYVDLDLTAGELACAQRIARESERQSNYGCMPTMRVEKWTPDND